MSSDDLEESREFSASINISGNVLTARSCYNTGDVDDQGRTKYKVDNGEVIWHRRSDGAVELAKKLLETVKDPAINVKHASGDMADKTDSGED